METTAIDCENPHGLPLCEEKATVKHGENNLCDYCDRFEKLVYD